MLQWMGGSRRKVTATRRSTQRRQKQYFEQKKRQLQQQHVVGLESGADGINTCTQDHKKHRSLDILSLLNLSTVAHESSSHTVKCSPKVFPSTDTPVDPIGFKEAGTPSNRQAVIVPPMKTTSSAHGDYGNVSFQHGKPDRWKISADPQLSVLELVGDDDSQYDESGACPSAYETHVSFSVEGLGKVARVTPVNSPPHVSFSLPSNSARQPFASKNHEFMLDDLDFGLAEVKQNQNSRTGGCSFKLPVFSRSKMDSFSKHEQSLSAIEEYAELDGCGRLFFQNADQGKDICSASSRFLDENFLDETTNDQSWRSWQRPMSDSSDFLEFGKHTMPDFSLNCPYRLKGGDAMNAGEMDNDVNILVSHAPPSKCQRYPKVGRCADFVDITDRQAWSCIATSDIKESISLPSFGSEESCSSSAVMGESTTDSLSVSTAKENIQNHVNVLRRPRQRQGVENFAKETNKNIPRGQQNLNWLGKHGRMSSDSNPITSKLVHNTNFGCLNNSSKHENWLFEETCVPADKDSGISSFLQTSGRKFSSWIHDFPVPQQQINAQLSFEKFGNNSPFDCLHNGHSSSEDFASHQSLGREQSSISPISGICPELIVSDLWPASRMTGIPSESSPFAAQQRNEEFPAVRGVIKYRENSEVPPLPSDCQKFKRDDEIYEGHFDVTKENRNSMDSSDLNGIGNKCTETADTIPYAEDSSKSNKVPDKFGRIINDNEYFCDAKTSLPCHEGSKTKEADPSPHVTMLESCVIQLCVQKVLKQTSAWKTLRNARI